MWNWCSEIIKTACQKNDYPQLASQIQAQWGRIDRKIAGYVILPNTVIYLNPCFWVTTTQQQREEIIYHETCHLIAYRLYYDGGHGLAWKECMKNCGVYPRVFLVI